MAFELLLIPEDELSMVKEQYRYHIDSYSGMWVVDAESSECLLFVGRDYLDPTVPSLFVLLNRSQNEKYYFEILERRYCAQRHLEQWLTTEDAKPDYVVVLKLGDGCKLNSDIIKTKICKAMQALNKRSDIEFIFIPHWNR
ncbi:hypothetical protein [Chitinibacter sp. ZOR0017]|uniref:hypothetical protein n=1 Tax=Chitinibacter sp. ZOR0017 TaxID=1339254 RepID=UPI000645618C|nr:hypothetical protein [Chitinibacter sp. ZOR0017]